MSKNVSRARLYIVSWYKIVKIINIMIDLTIFCLVVG